MDPKSKKIYSKIENFLEERKGSDRRKREAAARAKAEAEAEANRRSGEDRRDNVG